MEGGEFSNYIKVWLIVYASLTYCYIISKNVPKGIIRLLTILPIVCLFIALPLNLHSIHLGGITGFFIAWLSNFKLLLFAFGKGPLSSDPSISLPRFLAVGCLPIKIQQHPSQKLDTKSQVDTNPSQKTQIKNGPSQNIDQKSQIEINPSQKIDQKSQIETNPSQKIDPKSEIEVNPSQKTKIQDDSSLKTIKKGLNSPLNYTIKVLLLAIMVRVYDYSEYIHPTVILILYCFHIYFMLEIILAMVAAMARAILGLELEPQFDDPYLASSLQDFWGRRWNIMVSSILRPTVYDPVLSVCSILMGRKWASLPAIVSTFLVSALMHELMFFYLGREKPTWEVTWFFLLHGVSLVVEIAVKREFNGKWRLPRLISGALTVGFVMVTGFWLFFPQLLRCDVDERAFEEYAVVGAFLKNIGQVLTFKS